MLVNEMPICRKHEKVIFCAPAELEELRVAFGVNVRVLGYKFTQSFVGSDYPYHVADAQIGIIDQIVCSHAEVFYGTMHSYFSITIYEERVLWGKDNDSTYNVICPRHPKPHDRRKDAKPVCILKLAFYCARDSR
jgi:hypothetical protein